MWDIRTVQRQQHFLAMMIKRSNLCCFLLKLKALPHWHQRQIQFLHKMLWPNPLCGICLPPWVTELQLFSLSRWLSIHTVHQSVKEAGLKLSELQFCTDMLFSKYNRHRENAHILSVQLKFPQTDPYSQAPNHETDITSP